MELRCFRDRRELVGGVVDLLAEYLKAAPQEGETSAIMLSGGNTPLPAYSHIADHPVEAAKGLHIFLSDERMVPVQDPQSNYGQCQAMFRALGLSEQRALRVRTELPIDEAAQTYGEDLARVMEGGRVTLGLLGLGADGHTASLFSADDARRIDGDLAMPVSHEGGPDRVSVTHELIRQIENIVFIVAGSDKRDVVSKLLHEPTTVPAGLAVEGAGRVELWIDAEARPAD